MRMFGHCLSSLLFFSALSLIGVCALVCACVRVSSANVSLSRASLSFTYFLPLSVSVRANGPVRLSVSFSLCRLLFSTFAGEVHAGASMRAKGSPREHAGGMGAAVTERAQAALNRMRVCVCVLSLSCLFFSVSSQPSWCVPTYVCVCVCLLVARTSLVRAPHRLSLSSSQRANEANVSFSSLSLCACYLFYVRGRGAASSGGEHAREGREWRGWFGREGCVSPSGARGRHGGGGDGARAGRSQPHEEGCVCVSRCLVFLFLPLLSLCCQISSLYMCVCVRACS